MAWVACRERLEKTFDSFDQMEKHWGHFYNWYDTRTLKPLPPTYLSTVDSGNFLACLVALKQGLKEKTPRAGPGPAVAAGLADTFDSSPSNGGAADAGDSSRLLQNPPNLLGGTTGLKKWNTRPVDAPGRSILAGRARGRGRRGAEVWPQAFSLRSRSGGRARRARPLAAAHREPWMSGERIIAADTNSLEDLIRSQSAELADDRAVWQNLSPWLTGATVDRLAIALRSSTAGTERLLAWLVGRSSRRGD